MPSVNWKRPEPINSNLPDTTGPRLFGLTSSKDQECVSIDLSGTTLSFFVPRRNLADTEFAHDTPKDLRPFVNTISRTEYRYNPQTKHGTCEFYESGWWLYSKKRWRNLNHGFVKLLVSLETPARDEYEVFPNLFNESCLKNWLALYYRDRQSILDRTAFTTQSDGTLEIEFFEEHEVRKINPDHVPLQKLPQQISGMSCYFIYLNPGIIEFNLPIAKRDVLQIRFQIRYRTEDIGLMKQLNSETLKLAHQVISTVNIALSEREEKNLFMVNALTNGN